MRGRHPLRSSVVLMASALIFVMAATRFDRNGSPLLMWAALVAAWVCLVASRAVERPGP